MHAAGKQKKSIWKLRRVCSLLSSARGGSTRLVRVEHLSLLLPGCLCQSTFFCLSASLFSLSFIFFEEGSNRESEPIWIKGNDAQREDLLLLFCLFLLSPLTAVFLLITPLFFSLTFFPSQPVLQCLVCPLFLPRTISILVLVVLYRPSSLHLFL